MTKLSSSAAALGLGLDLIPSVYATQLLYHPVQNQGGCCHAFSHWSIFSSWTLEGGTQFLGHSKSI